MSFLFERVNFFFDVFSSFLSPLSLTAHLFSHSPVLSFRFFSPPKQNAHSVDHHVSVKCRRRGSDAKVVARVLAIGVECDLALLAVDDDDFWRGLAGVQLARSLPRLQESVSVCGFPLGGDTLSVTSGVVSRCETTSYVHSGTGSELLAVQIDAAVNSGNSGGPVFNGRGECVGVAFQSMAGSGEAEGVREKVLCFSFFFSLFVPVALVSVPPLSLQKKKK